MSKVLSKCAHSTCSPLGVYAIYYTFQPISAVEGWNIRSSLHFQLHYWDHDGPNLQCCELYWGADLLQPATAHMNIPDAITVSLHPPRHTPWWNRAVFNPQLTSNHPVAERLCPASSTGLPFVIHWLHAMHPFRFCRIQNQQFCFLHLPLSVCQSVCPLIKSILCKYKATDGFGGTSTEHVTEGHLIIALIINKPNMASVRTWAWLYSTCSLQGLAVTKIWSVLIRSADSTVSKYKEPDDCDMYVSVCAIAANYLFCAYRQHNKAA